MSPAVRAEVFLRSFAVQGSWNYRTLIGGGLAFALLPVLRRVHGPDADGLRQAVARHSGLFNSHPYLAAVAIGAVAALEVAGEEPAVVERFKSALRGSLGTVGDRLFWAGWRPLMVLAALGLLMSGVVWWAVVAVFLSAYNLIHLLARAWGFRAGYREGKGVGERLRRSRLQDAQRWIQAAGPFLLGLLLPTAAAGGLTGGVDGLAWIVAALTCGVVGSWLGGRIRLPLEGGLAAFVLIALLLGVT